MRWLAEVELDRYGSIRLVAIVRQTGSHRVLACEGRQTLTFAFHDRATVPSGLVRRILITEVGLTVDEALALL